MIGFEGARADDQDFKKWTAISLPLILSLYSVFILINKQKKIKNERPFNPTDKTIRCIDLYMYSFQWDYIDVIYDFKFIFELGIWKVSCLILNYITPWWHTGVVPVGF